MNLRCGLKEILHLVNDPSVKFFVAKPSPNDGAEFKLFENEVQKCHEASKAGCIPLKDNLRLYMIPMTKVTLASGGNQHLVELIKDARHTFLTVLVSDIPHRKPSKKSPEKWQIDMHKPWPTEQKSATEPKDPIDSTMATLDKSMLEDPEKLRLELLKKEREISILQEALRRSRSESNI
ncbi:hypothetical protein K493DRAFT_313753 [Basidiobolus meristosporus CBS 931.73]|uniref:Uncharacterized protein n=1 Tax=Basidiobolus meristosporus CBS 931.73 TaxID=1314790 RepID=A0A1Y1YJQ9_9FUNG|nr:hypothetical protein K493DRAFT_313753 [Basidiobolus meristosporus CBS 931.73]|eukprot:ORX98208.1 hypothetical protein K493DRAFT_313753 [Basidiobolus meristosporus CBS 931.73]